MADTHVASRTPSGAPPPARSKQAEGTGSAAAAANSAPAAAANTAAGANATIIPTSIEPIQGGIPLLQPAGVVFNDLAEAALHPEKLPPFAPNPEEALLYRLRLASIPLQCWSTNVASLSYQNFHRLGKLRLLMEIHEYLAHNKTQFNEELLTAGIHLVVGNVFRSFPTKLPEPPGNVIPDAAVLYCLNLDRLEPPNTEESHEMNVKYRQVMNSLSDEQKRSLHSELPHVTASEEEVQARDPSWPIIRWCYEFFLRYLVNDVETKVLRRYITHNFILKLLSLFITQDLRERELLKSLLHRIYAKFMTFRSFIRRSLHYVLSIFTYETEFLPGVSELLEILGSIINGFAHPLKQEHCLFFHNVLTPMHKVRSLPLYSPQLTYCICQFVSKDATLAERFIARLIRYWPRCHPSKEALFMEELYEVLERILEQHTLFTSILPSVLKVICPSLGSPHYHVCGKAITFITSDFIHPYAFNDINLFESYILQPLLTGCEHWNESLQEQARLTLHQRAPQYAADLLGLLQRNLVNQQEKQKAEIQRREQWATIEKNVQHITSKYEDYTLQLSEDHYLPPY